MEAGVKTGLLMNFNVTKLKDRIKRSVLPLRPLRVLRGKTILVPCRFVWMVIKMVRQTASESGVFPL
jgi:hypothetical protein